MKKRENYCDLIQKKVLAFIRQQNMFAQGEKVILGVSGGADSVCLLLLLYALKEELGLQLHVAHINHGVREEAADDAVYVERLCNERKIPFHLNTIEMNELAKLWKCSSEEAGRKARYDFLFRLCHETGAGKIAVAHNMGDCSETMLFHLFRGSGLAGLSGIQPVRGNIVRPLLCLERKEIEEYLRVKDIPYRHDRTNDEDDYTRNRIRHHILPYAEEQIVSGASRNVYEASRHIAQTLEFVEEQVNKVWQEMLLMEGERRLEFSAEGISKLHVVLQKGILRRAVEILSGSSKDITREHIEALLSLVEKKGNRQVYLPYGLRGERCYERLLLYIEEEPVDRQKEVVIDTSRLGTEPVTCCVGDMCITFCVLPFTGNIQDIPQNPYTKWLNYDIISGNLKIRYRQNGDYFLVKKENGMGRKKLKDYLMDEKIPRQERERLILLAQDSHVLWLIPHRISEYFKVDSETRNILQISVKKQGGGNYGKA